MKRRTFMGLVLTTVWAIVIVSAILFRYNDVAKMHLNEWGDFLAGVSAPVALLWLVIGYYQHGAELRLNTRALELQQKELHQQVEETKQLVKATSRQAQTAQEDLHHRQKREAREAEPEFISTSVSSSHGRVTIELQNRGGEARDVSLSYDGPFEVSFLATPYIERNGTARLKFASRSAPILSFPIRFTVNCTDRLDHIHHQDYQLSEDQRVMRVPSDL